MNAKKILTLFLAACLALSAVGCGSVFSSEYYYSEPFREVADLGESADSEVTNQLGLKNALVELIYSGESSGQFRFGNYSGSLLDDLAAVCHEIKTSTPIGAYAIEDISYDTSRIVSYYTATINIDYKRSPEEIAAVVSVSGLGELESHILSVMDSYASETVIEIYSSAASEEYIAGLIADSYYNNPLLIAEMPELRLSGYPESGPRRIYHIELDYSAEPETLVAMEEELDLELAKLSESLGKGDKINLALRCATMLCELGNNSDDAGQWADTVYGCIIEHSKNPVALAVAYKALCDSLKIPCYVVRGERKDVSGSPYAWNIVEIDGEYYHVDVSRVLDEPFLSFLLSDGDIWGRYDWDREKYPACDGPLGPESVFTAPNPPTTFTEPQRDAESPLPEGDTETAGVHVE